VGDVGPGGQPVVVTSNDGVNWQRRDATFPSNDPSSVSDDPYLTGIATSSGVYVATGTLHNKQSKKRVAAMWWSTDLGTWKAVKDHYNSPGKKTQIINGRDNASSVDAVTVTTTGTFYAVGNAFGNCAIWAPPGSVQNSKWTYWQIQLPPLASSAALRWVSANRNGLVVAAGYAVKTSGDVPIVVVRKGTGPWNVIQLQTFGGQGTVTGLTATGSGFVVAGEIGSAGARQAVTWSLPGSGNPQSSWPGISPLSRDVQEITALYTTGDTVRGAGQQGQAEIAVGLPEA